MFCFRATKRSLSRILKCPGKGRQDEEGLYRENRRCQAVSVFNDRNSSGMSSIENIYSYTVKIPSAQQHIITCDHIITIESQDNFFPLGYCLYMASVDRFGRVRLSSGVYKM